MNITFIMPYHQNLYDTFQSLSTQMHVTLLTPIIGRDIPTDIAYQIIPSKRIKPLGVVYSPFALWKMLSHNTDLVVVKHINAPGNFLVYLICKLKRIPCMIMVQEIQHYKNVLYHPFFKLLIFFLGKKTQILAVTQKGYEESKKYFPSTFYMPACINPERFLNKKNKLSRTLRFFCVSKYQKRKNLPILIEALETLIKKYPHLRFHLTIIGTAWSKGPINKHLLPEKKVYDDLLALLQQKKLEQNISLLKDVPYDDMPRHYADADLFVFPASQEPLGYALVEAMATGLTILCSTEVGAKCYVHYDMNGYFFSIDV